MTYLWCCFNYYGRLQWAKFSVNNIIAKAKELGIEVTVI